MEEIIKYLDERINECKNKMNGSPKMQDYYSIKAFVETYEYAENEMNILNEIKSKLNKDEKINNS